jgi:hypothetical protein
LKIENKERAKGDERREPDEFVADLFSRDEWKRIWIAVCRLSDDFISKMEAVFNERMAKHLDTVQGGGIRRNGMAI